MEAKIPFGPLPKARRCEFLDDDGGCDADCRLKPAPCSSSVQWVFNESSFSPDQDEDFVPVYPMNCSQSPSGGQSIALPDIEIRDCWEPGMGLSDDECLPRSKDAIRRCISSYGGHATVECDMIMTTLERDELVQYLQRQEIVKSFRAQTDQPILMPVSNSNVVIAQVSEPYGIQPPCKPIPKPRRKPAARKPKADVNADGSMATRPPLKKQRPVEKSVCNSECPKIDVTSI